MTIPQEVNQIITKHTWNHVGIINLDHQNAKDALHTTAWKEALNMSLIKPVQRIIKVKMRVTK